MIRFIVWSVPVAQPRQRHRIMTSKKLGKQFVHNYTPKKGRANTFKQDVKLAARQAHKGPPLTGPLKMELHFIMPRSGRMRWKTREMVQVPHVCKPDLDNLQKAVLDACKSILFEDDCQVMELHSEKWIADGDERPRVEVTVEEVAECQDDEE